MADQANPWSERVAVGQIPEAGLTCRIEADPATRGALASLGGLREVLSATATFELTHAGAGKVDVSGTVSARVGQTCVVTLDPIGNDINETVDLLFVPEADLPALVKSIDDATGDPNEMPDAPEPIVNGFIDLGRIATDAIFLGIDPYPRKPDAVFEPPVLESDPEDHPFAALRNLKPSPEPAAKSPKGKKRD